MDFQINLTYVLTGDTDVWTLKLESGTLVCVATGETPEEAFGLALNDFEKQSGRGLELWCGLER